MDTPAATVPLTVTVLPPVQPNADFPTPDQLPPRPGDQAGSILPDGRINASAAEAAMDQLLAWSLRCLWPDGAPGPLLTIGDHDAMAWTSGLAGVRPPARHTKDYQRLKPRERSRLEVAFGLGVLATAALAQEVVPTPYGLEGVMGALDSPFNPAAAPDTWQYSAFPHPDFIDDPGLWFYAAAKRRADVAEGPKSGKDATKVARANVPPALATANRLWDLIAVHIGPANETPTAPTPRRTRWR